MGSGLPGGSLSREDLRVGINAQIVTFAANYRQAGVSRFTQQLIQALQLRDRTNSYTVFVNETANQNDFRNSDNMRFMQSHLPTSKPMVRIVWEQLLLPAIVRANDLDVLHCPVNVAPMMAPCATALTIHDLTFLVFPDRFKRERRNYLRALTRVSARRARRIMTDSAHTKQDVIRLLGVPPDKIDVVYPGLDEAFHRPSQEDVAAFRARHNLPDRFIFNSGTIEPRKNIDQLVRAYGLLVKRGLKSCPLIIGGGTGWLAEGVFAEVERQELGDQIKFLGYVDQAELPLWYAAASLFVYPSLYEGFGLPPLEAMACGTPVITSSASSLPEVVGSAGITVDPTSVDDLASAITEVLESQEKRELMTQAGLRQAATFSWDEAARQTVAVYRQATKAA